MHPNDSGYANPSRFMGLLYLMNRTRKGSAASVTSSVTSKARDMRHQRKRGKIRPGRYASSFLIPRFLSLVSYSRALA